MLTTIVWCLTAGYLLYFILWYGKRPRAWLLARVPGRRGRILEATLQKVAMFVLLGLAPAIVVGVRHGASPAEFGLTLSGSAVGWAVTAVLSLLVFAVGYFNPAHARGDSPYPQMKVDTWSIALWLFNAAGLGLYLLAYEFMYRGLFFVPMLEYGVGLAVAVNTLVYMATHLHKGIGEAVAAVPFGIVLCLLTLETGSVLPAFLLHWLLAVGNSLGAIVRGPDYRFA
jgi:membrane protease YdiL (CAAX protease family)